MTLAVDQPIVNDPYQEPSRWWGYQERQRALVDGWRAATWLWSMMGRRCAQLEYNWCRAVKRGERT